ncbi:hypothetical protein BDF22DRAFT_111928 [Syncephalis plumigaleata]|nr:hypothetical protein BDF22DRAFT_111928 [Syncephalis plumigaleata]
MQEVEVPPRDTFAHYVYVERPQRNLLWWFNTKRHNIAFGLYYLPGQVEGAQVKAELKDDPTSSINHANTSNNADANRTLMPIASRMGRSTSMSIPSNTSNDELMASGHKHARNHRSGSSVSSMASTITQGQYRSSSPTNLSIDQGNATITAAGLARTPTAADSVASTLHTPLGATNDTTATMANTSQMGQAPITISRTASPAASIVSASGVVAPLNGSNSPNLPPPPPTPTMRSRQRTNFRPKDPRMVELMPVEVCESSRRTIRGQYEVKEAGTYVFIFDNSFSWNTTKRLTFFVAAKDGSSEPTATLDYAGWVLKRSVK